MLRILLLVCFTAFASCEIVRYDGFKVLEIVPGTQEQVEILRKIPQPRDANSMRMVVDWQPECVRPDFPCFMMVAPEVFDDVVKRLNVYDIQYDVVVEDQQKVLDDEKARIQEFQRKNTGNYDLWDTEYHPYGEIVEWMFDIAEKRPELASIVNLGQSYEGREMYLIRMGLNGTAPTFFFNSNIHAREWLSPATTQYIINRLVDGYDANDPATIRHLTSLEWHIAPMFNVDGNVYTWETDRNWRKTRRPNPGTNCVGTDPNRNSPAGFGGPGSSGDPCSNSYRGPAPFSEVEVSNMATAFSSPSNRVVGYIDIHTSAQNLLEPWGYTNTLPPINDVIDPLSASVSAAIQGVNGFFFPWGPAYTTIYPASGILSDEAYDNGEIDISWAWELRGPGFNPPPSLIRESGAEIYEGIKVVAEFLIANYA